MRRNVEEIKNELDLVQKEIEYIDDINMVIEQKKFKNCSCSHDRNSYYYCYNYFYQF